MNIAPNNEQWLAVLRQILPIIGTLLSTFGLVSAQQFDVFAQAIIQLVGAGTIIWGFVWALKVNTVSALVESTDKLPGVQGVVTTKGPVGEALADGIKSATVVAAGTVDASKVASGTIGKVKP